MGCGKPRIAPRAEYWPKKLWTVRCGWLVWPLMSCYLVPFLSTGSVSAFLITSTQLTRNSAHNQSTDSDYTLQGELLHWPPPSAERPPSLGSLFRNVFHPPINHLASVLVSDQPARHHDACILFEKLSLVKVPKFKNNGAVTKVWQKETTNFVIDVCTYNREIRP